MTKLSKPAWMDDALYKRLCETPHQYLTRDERSLKNSLVYSAPGPILKPWEEGRE